MQLYGQNLADVVPDGVTYLQATDVCGLLEHGLLDLYPAFQPGALQFLTHPVDSYYTELVNAIDSSGAPYLKGAVDDELASLYAFDAMVQSAGDMSQPMPADYVQALRAHVSGASRMAATVNNWYAVPSWDGISDGIVKIVGGIAATIANAASKAVGNTLGALWWVIALVVIGFFAIRRGKKELLS